MDVKRLRLPVAWLLVWATAVLTATISSWWVVAVVGVLLWELTWRMKDRSESALLSLRRVSPETAIGAIGAGIVLFLMFLMVVKTKHLPVYGKVPSAKVLWTVLIAPMNEELFFRGLMYRTALLVYKEGRIRAVIEPLVVVVVGLVFAAAHGRHGIYFDLTLVAGIVYGVLRWRSGSVIASILCHASYNACIMWAFGR